MRGMFLIGTFSRGFGSFGSFRRKYFRVVSLVVLLRVKFLLRRGLRGVPLVIIFLT